MDRRAPPACRRGAGARSARAGTRPARGPRAPAGEDG